MRERHIPTLVPPRDDFYARIETVSIFQRIRGGGDVRSVAATVTAPKTRCPAERNARVASVRLLPVVTTSSTKITAAPGGWRATRKAPRRLVARSAARKPA